MPAGANVGGFQGVERCASPEPCMAEIAGAGSDDRGAAEVRVTTVREWIV
jgi:hypothetical protein